MARAPVAPPGRRSVTADQPRGRSLRVLRRRQIRRQDITRWSSRWTLMRHFLLPGAVPRHAFGMLETAPKSLLVTPTSLALLHPPSLAGAATGTVNLPAVTPAADERMAAATGAAEETRWHRRRPGAERGRTWTHVARN